MVTLIVAMDDEGWIGYQGGLPWDVPGDLKHFRTQTMGSVLVMGRATWESLPGSMVRLKGRVNYVITRQAAERTAENADRASETEGPFFMDTVELAFRHARRHFPEQAKEIFVIGGRQIYEYAMRRRLVDRMLISQIKGTHKGDVKFPDMDDSWHAKVLETHDDFDVIECVRGR